MYDDNSMIILYINSVSIWILNFHCVESFHSYTKIKWFHPLISIYPESCCAFVGKYYSVPHKVYQLNRCSSVNQTVFKSEHSITELAIINNVTGICSGEQHQCTMAAQDKLNEINNFDLHQYEMITDIKHHYIYIYIYILCKPSCFPNLFLIISLCKNMLTMVAQTFFHIPV